MMGNVEEKRRMVDAMRANLFCQPDHRNHHPLTSYCTEIKRVWVARFYK